MKSRKRAPKRSSRVKKGKGITDLVKLGIGGYGAYKGYNFIKKLGNKAYDVIDQAYLKPKRINKAYDAVRERLKPETH